MSTCFYFIQGSGLEEAENFTSLAEARKEARRIKKAVTQDEDFGQDGTIWISRMTLPWPISKKQMLAVLSGSGYAEKIEEIERIEW